MTTEFERGILLDTLGKAAQEYTFSADESERSILVDRFGLLSMDSLEGKYVAERQEDGSVVVDGSFQADLAQPCVVSLEPVPDHIEDSFHVRFVPGLVLEPIDEDDLESLAEMEDQEPLEGDCIPVAEIVAQYLALSLNPYPRVEEATAPAIKSANVRLMTEDEAEKEATEMAEAAPGPFDALKKLKAPKKLKD